MYIYTEKGSCFFHRKFYIKFTVSFPFVFIRVLFIWNFERNLLAFETLSLVKIYSGINLEKWNQVISNMKWNSSSFLENRTFDQRLVKENLIDKWNIYGDIYKTRTDYRQFLESYVIYCVVKNKSHFFYWCQFSFIESTAWIKNTSKSN